MKFGRYAFLEGGIQGKRETACHKLVLGLPNLQPETLITEAVFVLYFFPFVVFPSTHPVFFVPFFLCYSLENAKPSSQAASVTIPDHLSINLSQPSTPSSSSSSTTTPSLATAGTSDAPSSLPNPLPTAPCVSSLLGMKPIPLLALNVVSAAKGTGASATTTTTSAVPCVTNKLKGEKQRFSPY